MHHARFPMISHFRETFGQLNFMHMLYGVLKMEMCLRLNYISVTKKQLYLKLNGYRDNGEISFKE
jgi:hypothetical protein